jgi:hypothetical protein
MSCVCVWYALYALKAHFRFLQFWRLGSFKLYQDWRLTSVSAEMVASVRYGSVIYLSFVAFDCLSCDFYIDLIICGINLIFVY